MATISGFKAQMATGGARPNQFRVELTFPAFVGGLSVAAGQAAEFLCKATQLPASTIGDIETFFRGRPVHFAGERTFAPWSVTVFQDNDFLIRNVMEIWSDRVLNYDATNGVIAPSQYQVDMTVYQLDRNDQVIKSYKFFDAYPISVGQIGLDFDNNNSIETFDVEFQYNYFIASDI